MTTRRNSSGSEAGERVRRVELLISNLLRIGVISSLTLIVIGTILSFLQHPAYVTSSTELQNLTQAGVDFPFSWRAVVAGVQDLQGQAIVTVGLLLLIATPIGRVAVSILAFIYQRDRVYTLITMAVLCLLLLSFVLGKVE